MGWNEQLSLYQSKKGGTFLGPAYDSWSGELILEYKNAPLVVRGEMQANGRYVSTQVRSMTTLELERPYTLTISKENVVSQGIKLVLNREDYGCPKLSKKRGIRTKEKAFTKLVLRSTEFVQLLNDWPDLSFSVTPSSATGGGGHVLCAFATLPSEMEIDNSWGLDSTFTWNAQNARQSALFEARMDGIIALVQRGRDAVREWRM